MSNKRSFDADDTEDTKAVEEDNPDALTGAPVPKDQIFRPKLFKSARNDAKRLIVILEKSNLEIVKTHKDNFELLNCDQHMSQIRKYKKDPAFCRPDITHQVWWLYLSYISNLNYFLFVKCLLMLFDSPLNRAGLLQVYIHTDRNVLIEINPQTRFPRTFVRFANLMGIFYRLGFSYEILFQLFY